MSSNIVPANADAEKAKAGAQSNSLKLIMIASFFDPKLQEIGTRQVRQVPRASLPVATHAKKDRHVRKNVYTLSRTEQSLTVLVNEEQILHTVQNFARGLSGPTLENKTPLVFKVHVIFHSIVIVQKAIHVKALMCSRSYSTGTISIYTVQKILKEKTAFAEADNLVLHSKLVLRTFCPFQTKKFIFCTNQAGLMDCTS